MKLLRVIPLVKFVNIVSLNLKTDEPKSLIISPHIPKVQCSWITAVALMLKNGCGMGTRKGQEVCRNHRHITFLKSSQHELLVSRLEPSLISLLLDLEFSVC